MESFLEARNVGKFFGTAKTYQVKVLNQVSIKIDAGEFIAIVGPSGAGKTTLLNILSGIDNPTEGDVLFKGKILGTEIANRIYLGQRGFVFQQFNLIDHLSAIENVMWPIKVLGYRGKMVSNKENKEYAMQLLERIGLKTHIDKFPGQLSGGQQQRVAIARALTQHQLIFADEPTGALDNKSSKEIEELLHEINEIDKSTIVMVTHDDSIASRCKRVISIFDGKIANDTKNQQKSINL